MSSPYRIVRFRHPGSAAPTWIDCRIQLEIRVDEIADPAGYIVELAAAQGAPVRWSYVLADGQASGLQSAFSRRELETQIQDYYFLKLTADHRHSA